MFEDHTVMLIGAGMNYLLTAIKDRLNETSLTVRVSGIDIDTMKIDDDIRAMIIYTDID